MVVDELVLKLLFDATAFKQGQRDSVASTEQTSAALAAAAGKGEAAQTTAADKIVRALARIADQGDKLAGEQEDQHKRISQATDRTGVGVEALVRRFLGLYAVVTAGRGLKEFVSDLTASDSALGRTARNIDVTVRGLSTFQLAAEASGGSAAGITGAMQGLSAELQRAALTGQSGIIPAFRALGINLADSGGKARDVRDIFRDLNRAAQGMDPARFSALAHMAGIGDEGTINLLEKTTQEYDALLAAQEKYAATQADADAAQKRQTGWRELLITSTAIGRTILTALTPAIVGAMKAVQGWADANQDWIRTEIVAKVGQLSDYLKGLDWDAIGKGVQDFTGEVRDIVKAADDAAKGIDGGSALYRGLEALGLLAGVRVLRAVTGLATALGKLSALSLPGWFAALLAAAGVADIAAFADAQKVADGDDPSKNDLSVTDSGYPFKGAPGSGSVGGLPMAPSDGKEHSWIDDAAKRIGQFFGLVAPDPAVVPLPPDRYTYTAPDTDGNALHRDDEVPASGGGLWGALKRLVGFGDDSKVKDDVATTAKATAGLFDLMRRSVGLGVSTENDAINFNAATGRGGSAGMANLRYGRGPDGRYRHGAGAGAGGPFNLRTPDKPGMYRPEYKLSAADLDDYVVGTVAGEAVTSNPESVDAVINNMLNRVGSKGWGPSANLHEVASAPGQYAGHRTATPQEAERIRARIRAIASGGVPDNTNGSNSYRAASYGGPWARKHAADGRVVGGNRFAYEPGIANGPYAPYREPRGTPTAQAPVPTGTSAQAVTDAQVFAARQRLAAGGRDPRDAAMVGRYLKQQNAPPVPLHPGSAPTVGHAVRHALMAIGHANRLLHHDGAAVPVDVTERSAQRLSSALGHRGHVHRQLEHAMLHTAPLREMQRAALAGGYALHATTNNVDRSSTSTTTIGEMHLHTRATDGPALAADLERHLARSRDATQANSGLA